MRLKRERKKLFRLVFQSTHPVRDATSGTFKVMIKAIFQSTHPVRDATPAVANQICDFAEFQSTHPVRDATMADLIKQNISAISIHAPREGCDFLLKLILMFYL